MNYQNLVLKVNSNLNLLAPIVRQKALAAITECRQAGLDVEIFEGWRSPERQAMLFAKGRSNAEKRVTNASEFMSLHQYGLACDIVFIVNDQPSWDGDFKALEPIFMKQGFDRPPSFEKAHYQISNGLSPQMIHQMFLQSSTQGIWIALGLV